MEDEKTKDFSQNVRKGWKISPKKGKETRGKAEVNEVGKKHNRGN